MFATAYPPRHHPAATPWRFGRARAGARSTAMGLSKNALLSKNGQGPSADLGKNSRRVDQFGYTGHFHHIPTGMALTWFRAYVPGTGRWLNRDPIAERGGMNLYGYVGNRPINAYDPFGLCEPISATVGAIIVGGVLLGSYVVSVVLTTDFPAIDISLPSLPAGSGAFPNAGVGWNSMTGPMYPMPGSQYYYDPSRPLNTQNSKAPEAYDSPADAIGAKDGVADFVPGTKQGTINKTLQANGYSERWVVQDSNGNFHHVAYNPRTGKCTGGGGSSHE